MLYHTARINCLAWSPDSKMVATGSLDTCIIIYEIDKPASSRMTIKGAHLGGVYGLAFTDDHSVVSSGEDACDRVWKVNPQWYEWMQVTMNIFRSIFLKLGDHAGLFWILLWSWEWNEIRGESHAWDRVFLWMLNKPVVVLWLCRQWRLQTSVWPRVSFCSDFAVMKVSKPNTQLPHSLSLSLLWACKRVCGWVDFLSSVMVCHKVNVMLSSLLDYARRVISPSVFSASCVAEVFYSTKKKRPKKGES